MSTLSAGEAIFVGIIGIWLFFSLCSNMSVIIVVIRDRKMRSVTNILICNLAISDIFLGAIFLPQNLHDVSHTEEFYEGDALCRMVNFLPILLVSCSIFSLVAMSCERLRAIVHHDRSQLTVAGSKRLVIGVWLLATIVSIPTALEYSVTAVDEDSNDSRSMSSNSTWSPATSTQHLRNNSHLVCGSRGYNYGLFNGVFILMCSYIIPSVFIGVNYSRVGVFILRKSKQVQPEIHVPRNGDGHTNGSTYASSHIVSRKKVKIVKMLIIIAALFVICWLPYFVIIILAKITGKDESSYSDGPLNMFRITLSAFSVSYNAWLYFIFNASFRHGFRRLFRDMTACCRNGSDVTPHMTADDCSAIPSGCQHGGEGRLAVPSGVKSSGSQRSRSRHSKTDVYAIS